MNIKIFDTPEVQDFLQTVSGLDNNQGVLLDDFTCASFSYQPLAEPHRAPWVGIFHHAIHRFSAEIAFGSLKMAVELRMAQLLRYMGRHRFVSLEGEKENG